MGLQKIFKNKLFIAGLIFVVILFSFWLYSSNNKAVAAEYKQYTAALGNIDVFIEADGIISAEKTSINFLQTGILEQIDVSLGDKVEAGQTLAKLNNSKLQYQLNQVMAAYDINIAKVNRLDPGVGEEVVVKLRAVDSAKAALKAEENIYNELITRYAVGTSQELAELAKLEKAESDVLTAVAQLELTNATYGDAQYATESSFAAVEQAKLSIAETTLKSPMAGVITGISGSLGQLVGGSQQGAVGFITIAKTDNLTLNSLLDEEDIGKIKVGQNIEAEFTSLDKTIPGKVNYVSPVPKIDPNGSVGYEVRMTVGTVGTGILDGMSANIKFITKSVENVVSVSNKAITIVDGKTMIYYHGKNEEILTKNVATGFTDGQVVEISSGLKAGDKYVIKVSK